jgi:hypothetical protein
MESNGKDPSPEPALAGPGAGSGPEGKAPVHPATTKQKISLFGFLLLLAIAVTWYTYRNIQEFNKAALAETSTRWELPAGARLSVGPDTFHYDPLTRTLNHRGPLDAQQRIRLRDLLEFEKVPEGVAGAAPASSSPPRPNLGSTSISERAAPATAALTVSSKPATAAPGIVAVIHSYHVAIDELAYQSNAQQVGQIQLLLQLGLLGGALGAILRSLVDFVGHACYTGQLDLTRWWPLYATRPLVGAILGFVLVVLFKARLLTSSDVHGGTDSFWWLGMAVIGGFSTVDVTLRLRLAAKALFGVTGDKKV